MKAEKRSENNVLSDQQPQIADDELIASVARQDEAAFRTLYMRYYERLRQFIMRVTRRSDLAEEVLNDTFFTVWNKAGNFGGYSSVSTWIFGIAYNKCLKALERTERWQTRYFAMDQEQEFSADYSPDEAADDAQLRRRVHNSLNQLSPEQRMVFELTHFLGYSYSEIAAVADCSINTVKTRMFHARRKLQALLINER
jgi:RNA polymerase sigma-70 factor (ECF subfamily)